jgi:hypothetical protein
MTENNSIEILGVSVFDRNQEAGKVQEVLTRYGCSIKTRLGMHEVSDDFCSKSGLIILELFGDEEGKVKLASSLKEIPGVEVQKMVFEN